jgi:hypothetical protein
MGGVASAIPMVPEQRLLMGTLRRMLGRGYWYLATVYTKHPEGLHEAYKQANEAAAGVIREFGGRIFCPIGHSHSLCSIYGTSNGIDGETDAEFWKWFDQPFLDAAEGLIVVMMPRWEESHGIAHEIASTREAGKPILYLSWPGLRPDQLERALC